jgi:hypothetical protein
VGKSGVLTEEISLIRLPTKGITRPGFWAGSALAYVNFYVVG